MGAPRSEQCGDPQDIEECIAFSLEKNNTYSGELGSVALNIILASVMQSMIEKQTVAGWDVAIRSRVTRMEVAIAKAVLSVSATAAILQPIKAILTFQYTLVNAQETGKLALQKNTLRVSDDIPFWDVPRKAALALVNVPQVAQQELSNPNHIIEETLPARLREHGVNKKLTSVQLQLLPTVLKVTLAVKSA